MSAADKREALEAALWRLTGSQPDTAVTLVDAALEAAETYANAAAGEAIDNLTRTERATRTRLQAERRAVLAEAIGAQP